MNTRSNAAVAAAAGRVAAGAEGAAGLEAADPEPGLAAAERRSQLLDPELRELLPTFEMFFKTFGFKRVHGRVWGLLVLAERPLSSREVADELELSLASSASTLAALTEWGAVSSGFDHERRCHLHAPVGNALSVVATVFRRREQVAFQQFRSAAMRALEIVKVHKGERDPRVLTLRSIVATCDLAEALMQLILSAVGNALGDPRSLLARTLAAALKTGVGLPAQLFTGAKRAAAGERAPRRRALSRQEAG
jgi:DNA-binding transcriptional regulator GbsR (MarR family)